MAEAAACCRNALPLQELGQKQIVIILFVVIKKKKPHPNYTWLSWSGVQNYNKSNKHCHSLLLMWQNVKRFLEALQLIAQLNLQHI